MLLRPSRGGENDGTGRLGGLPEGTQRCKQDSSSGSRAPRLPFPTSEQRRRRASAAATVTSPTSGERLGARAALPGPRSPASPPAPAGSTHLGVERALELQHVGELLRVDVIVREVDQQPVHVEPGGGAVRSVPRPLGPPPAPLLPSRRAERGYLPGPARRAPPDVPQVPRSLRVPSASPRCPSPLPHRRSPSLSPPHPPGHPSPRSGPERALQSPHLPGPRSR